jgi:hypothetical protein
VRPLKLPHPEVEQTTTETEEEDEVVVPAEAEEIMAVEGTAIGTPHLCSKGTPKG